MNLSRLTDGRGPASPHCSRAGSTALTASTITCARSRARSGKGLRDEVCGESGRLVGVDPGMQDRRFDRVDRDHRRAETTADDLGDRALT